jgi:oxepin-CoA hydrolase/3-oxo-5,6-dehydrosuberyl-CoA semialdehyde dehydrogenase
VHINAFNFPAWGFAENAATALLAGMPVLSKPATSSAMVAHRIMEIVVEAKMLPQGALSLLVGSPRDLPALLGAQDVLAFTGSGDTGARLRALPNVIRESVRGINVEATASTPRCSARTSSRAATCTSCSSRTCSATSRRRPARNAPRSGA